MTHIILTGATGTAGAAMLSHAIASPAISKISLLSRRPVALVTGHDIKVHTIMHADFETYPPGILAQLQGATACIWALGTCSRGVSETEYEKITVAFPAVAARAFGTAGLAGEGEGWGWGFRLRLPLWTGRGSYRAESDDVCAGSRGGLRRSSLPWPMIKLSLD